MSKLKMLKFEAAALQKKSKILIENLQKSGLCQFEKAENNGLFSASVSDSEKMYERYAATVDSAMKILSEKGAKFSGGLFSGRKELDEKQFADRIEAVPDSFVLCENVIALDKRMSDLAAEKSRCETLFDVYSAWSNLDIPMTGVKTEFSTFFVGSFPRLYSLEELKSEISERIPEISDYEIEIVFSSKMITAVAVVCHKSCEKELMAALRAMSFTLPLSELTADNVGEKLSELKQDITLCESGINECKEKFLTYFDKADDIKFAYDYFLIKADEYRALDNAGFSENTIYLCGYLAECSKEKVKKIIEKSGGAVVFCEPSEEDDVPVIMKNGFFSEPVEGIVEMYATPSKNDIDPSKVMAFFYYLLFGMMLSDAGYGLILGLGSWLILKFTTVEGSMRKTLRMFVYCGISTVFWGTLFGSWFGDAIPVIQREFFGVENPGSVAVWFDPITDPITLLLFSFVIGIIHLFIGLCAAGYMKWRDGDKLSAIFDTIPVMMTVGGAAPLAAGVLVEMPRSITSVCSYIAIAGVILVVLTTSRQGNIFVRLGGGLYGLYNMASGYLSDILSYSRLLALGLATGSIGSVVNMLAVMVEGPVVKEIVFILVFIVGHTLNMAINVLGAYVHTNRLQFVELFSKFYEGGGRAFTPFTFNTKYFKLKEENKND